LSRLAPREGQGGDQDIGVKDDPHGMEGLFADRMDELIHIFFRPDPERLSLQGCLSLKFSPLLALKIQAQGLPDQFALGSVFLLGCSLGLSEELRRKRNSPRLGGTHRATSYSVESYLVRQNVITGMSRENG
jgi:hypothetical protein